jgi:hypothetical protein
MAEVVENEDEYTRRAIKEFEDGIEKRRKEIAYANSKIEQYQRQIAGLRDQLHKEEFTGPARIGDWANVDRADALHEYMRQYPMGHHLKISTVAKDLMRGGVKAGKLRPGQTKGELAELERNLLISASRHDKYAWNPETREIWRKG